MSMHCFWLASNSPRRREMLTWLDWPFQVIPSQVDESILENEPPYEYVRRLAWKKVQVNLPNIDGRDIVIAADTIVEKEGSIYGKPADIDEAREMLRRLRGRTHQVMTAIAIRRGQEQDFLQDICRSEVLMREYSDEEIEGYLASGDAFDKAGSYSIQNDKFQPAMNFSGCFASVMGLPLCHLERNLRKLADYHARQMLDICRTHLCYQCSISKRVLAGENIG